MLGFISNYVVIIKSLASHAGIQNTFCPSPLFPSMEHVNYISLAILLLDLRSRFQESKRRYMSLTNPSCLIADIKSSK